MAKLCHLAILTHQPAKLDFYKRVFEMKEMYRTKNGSVHLSDGEVNLAISTLRIRRNRGTSPAFIIWVFTRGQQGNWPAHQGHLSRGRAQEREATYAEGRGSDPDGNLFDISTVRWGDKRRMDL